MNQDQNSVQQWLRNTITFLLCVLIFSSCYEEYEIEITSEPVLGLWVDSRVNDQICVCVARSTYTSENYLSDRDTLIDESTTVDLFVNGSKYEVLKREKIATGLPVFIGSYVIKEGDLLRIEAKHPKYGMAFSEVRVPYKVPIESSEISIDSLAVISRYNKYAIQDKDKYFYDCSGSLRVSIMYTDPKEYQNYYKIYFGLNSDIGRPQNYNVRDTKILCFDPIFKESVPDFKGELGEFEGIMYPPYSDRSISGKTHKLTFIVKLNHYTLSRDYHTDSKLRFYLCSVNEESFKSALSEWNDSKTVTGELGRLGLGDPRWRYSNVSTNSGQVSVWSYCEENLGLDSFLYNYISSK